MLRAEELTVVVDGSRDWIDYLTAYGALAAVLIAMAVAVRETRAARHTHRRDEERDRRRQAEHANAWIERVQDPTAAHGVAATGYVSNSSSQPIYGVLVVDEHAYRRDPDSDWMLHAFDMVPPDRTLTFDAQSQVRPATARPAVVPLSIVFTDAAGHPWQRHEGGTLRFAVESTLDTRYLPRKQRWRAHAYRSRLRARAVVGRVRHLLRRR